MANWKLLCRFFCIGGLAIIVSVLLIAWNPSLVPIVTLKTNFSVLTMQGSVWLWNTQAQNSTTNMPNMGLDAGPTNGSAFQPKPLTITKQSLRQTIKNDGLLPEQCKINTKDFKWAGCSFPPLKTSIQQCMLSAGIKKVAFFGCSQARRYMDNLYSLIKPCTVTKKSHGRQSPILPSVGYYINDKSWKYQVDTTSTKLFCSGCDGVTYKCGDVSYEYIGIQSLNGTAITMPPDANTFLEFLLKKYLNENHPDMIIFEIPFNHIKNFLDEATFNEQFNRVLDLIQTTMKDVKSIVILPGFAEHEYKRTKGNKWYMAKFFGQFATDRIYSLNTELGRILKSRNLLEDQRFTTFINLNNATRETGQQCEDGVHYRPSLYRTVLNSLFGVLCEDSV